MLHQIVIVMSYRIEGSDEEIQMLNFNSYCLLRN